MSGSKSESGWFEEPPDVAIYYMPEDYDADNFIIGTGPSYNNPKLSEALCYDFTIEALREIALRSCIIYLNIIDPVHTDHASIAPHCIGLIGKTP